MSKATYFIGFGILVLALAIGAQNLFLVNCGGGLGCLVVSLIFALPGLILQSIFEFNLAVVRTLNIAFYFIIGGIIGLVVEKIKNK